MPAAVPYLSAEETRIAKWRTLLAAVPGFRVGVV
jgi:hypothetical protein